MSGTRSRGRDCLGGKPGDYGCEGTDNEIKVCYQDTCAPIVKECSQSKWNLHANSEAQFKVNIIWSFATDDLK